MAFLIVCFVLGGKKAGGRIRRGLPWLTRLDKARVSVLPVTVSLPDPQRNAAAGMSLKIYNIAVSFGSECASRLLKAHSPFLIAEGKIR